MYIERFWDNSCDIFKDFSPKSFIYKFGTYKESRYSILWKYTLSVLSVQILEMHFLDLRKTSASSRRPVFANPRLRRDLNLRKIDQSKSNGLNSPLWVNLWIFKLNDQLSFLSQMEKLNSLFTFVNCFMDFQTNGPLDCLSHSKQLNGVWDH